MADEQPAITLYRLQMCPFYERIVRTLGEQDFTYQSRLIEPMHSSRNIAKRVSDKRSVPAIVDDNTDITMSGSTNIVGYLEHTYGEGA